jgi:hypothetical protein
MTRKILKAVSGVTVSHPSIKKQMMQAMPGKSSMNNIQSVA